MGPFGLIFDPASKVLQAQGDGADLVGESGLVSETIAAE